MCEKGSLLSKIWDTMQMIGAVDDKCDAKAITDFEMLEEQIYALLDDEGKKLFAKYIELSSDLENDCEREAFASGIRFATAYISETKANKEIN